MREILISQSERFNGEDYKMSVARIKKGRIR